MKRAILLLLLVLVISLNAGAAERNTPKVLIITYFVGGAIGLELFPEEAQLTVANFLQYVDDGFYNDIIFHRAIYDFGLGIAQTGSYELTLNPDPPPQVQEKTDGLRGPIINESDNGLLNEYGTVAMALLPDEPNSATSGFYINTMDNPHLDGEYCVFGRVISGMGFAEWISSLGYYTIDGLQNVPLYFDGAVYNWIYILGTVMAPPGYWLSSDLNNTGIVNMRDFAIFANNWKAEGEELAGDINEEGPDGIVDYNDLGVFSGQYLQTTDWF